MLNQNDEGDDIDFALARISVELQGLFHRTRNFLTLRDQYISAD